MSVRVDCRNSSTPVSETKESPPVRPARLFRPERTFDSSTIEPRSLELSPSSLIAGSMTGGLRG